MALPNARAARRVPLRPAARWTTSWSCANVADEVNCDQLEQIGCACARHAHQPGGE
jgi:hypothetical protein